MDVKQVVEELIALPEQPAPVASVYLDTRRRSEHHREEVRIFVQDASRRALKGLREDSQQEGLRRTLAAIDEYVTGLLRQQIDEFATGVALFSCPPIGLFRVVATRTPFRPMQFLWDRRPRLVPLLRTAGQSPPLILATLDSTGGGFFEVRGGMVDEEARSEQPFPGFHKMGGWSQFRFQRQIDQARSRNLQQAAEMLSGMVVANPDALLVLFGQPGILAEFEGHLHPRTVERIVTRLPSPPLAAGDTLLRAAREPVRDYLHARATAIRDVALGEAARNGIGVLGVDDVMQAMAAGQMYRLLIDPDLKATGWRCRTCDAAGASKVNRCEYCGNEVSYVDLVEEVVRRAYRADAEIEFLPEDGKLPDGQGLAGILRHRTVAPELEEEVTAAVPAGETV